MTQTAILVGLYLPESIPSPEERLDELNSLVLAAGASVVDALWQPALKEGIPRDSGTWIGKGKVEEIAARVAETEAKMVVCDAELSPAQIRNLEKLLGCRVLDRSELILDIFAGRARSRAAVLQVELAQLEYTAPRLRGMWTHLERQAGSSGFVGSRGPGEKQIEIDRRIVDKRVAKLKEEIAGIQERRTRMVQGRSDYAVSLVGYTNAGKTTLMEALTGQGEGGVDALFATLDTKSRRWRMDGMDVVLSDTVGFVRDLPHHLVASFRATLEEAVHADLRLHVIDASHPLAVDQARAVREVLAELGCDPEDTLPVLNKVDAADPGVLGELHTEAPGAVEVSALTGRGLPELASTIGRRARAEWAHLTLEGSAAEGKLRAWLHEHGTVRLESFEEDRWRIELDLPRRLLAEMEDLQEG